MKMKILQEPFFHFLLLGGILYLYYLSTPSAQQTNQKEKIVISSSEIEFLQDEYQKRMHRAMNQKEQDLYVEKLFYDKVLLNEAYSLGLDKKDEVITKRLLSQMQFIMKNSIKIVEPTEEQLKEYYKQNIKEYSHIDSLSFTNIFVKSPQDRQAKELYELLSLSDISPNDAASYGEQCRLSNIVKDITADEARVIYGNYFATKLFALNSGVWHSAITSKFGAHIVYVTDKKVTQPYSFDEVEDRVYEDYMMQKRREQKQKSFQKIASQYKLEIE